MITMLVVDDDRREHDIIEYLLEKFHFSIKTTHAEDGMQAKQLLETNSYDILLTDIQMPFLNGLELAKFSRTQNPICEILFFSGYDDFDYIKEALSLKAINYILKPIAPDEFQKSMQEILDNIARRENPYKEYEKTLSQNFYENPLKTDNHALSEEIQDSELLKNVEEAIRLNNHIQLEQSVHSLITKYKSEAMISHIYIRYLFTSLLHILIHCIPNLSNEDLQSATEKIYTLNHFSDLCDYIEQYLEQAITYLKEIECTPNYAVYHVMQYIEKNYAQDLGLDQLAEQVYLSPKYLSTIFSQITGTTLNKYIRSIRMKKALDLICHTNRKIADVSLSVGYPNVSYFCKLFTEEYGVTPEKYRSSKETL